MKKTIFKRCIYLGMNNMPMLYISVYPWAMFSCDDVTSHNFFFK